MQRGFSSWWSALATAAGFVVLAAASRPATFRMPLNQDAGAYLYIGDLVLNGGTPYVDAADNKGPVTFLLFGLIGRLAGIHTLGVRLTLLIFASLAALAMAGYVGHFAGRRIGILAGASLAILGSSMVVQGAEPNTEQYGLAPLVGAWWLAARGGRRSSAGAGALAALATLINVGFVVIVPLVVFELWRSTGTSGRRSQLLAAAVGALGVTMPLLAWLAFSGALGDMRIQVLRMASSAVGGHVLPSLHPDRIRPPGVDLGYLLSVPAPGLWLAGLTGGLIALTDVRLRKPAIGALTWIALMTARVKLAPYEYQHYYDLAIPGIAAGIALGAATLWPAKSAATMATTALLIAAPVCVYVIIPQAKALDQPSQKRWPYPSYAAAYDIARFISHHTRPHDLIFMPGGDGQVYWLAQRRAPTRFFQDYALDASAGYRGERQRQLLARPPTAIGALPGDLRFGRDLNQLFLRFPYRLAYKTRSGGKVWLRSTGRIVPRTAASL
jgi:hypothetical protein